MLKSKKLLAFPKAIFIVVSFLAIQCSNDNDTMKDNGQICHIENGGFDNWIPMSNGNGISYELPVGWTESIFANASSRFRNGEGFFNKNVSRSEEEMALLIKRSTQNKNNGFARFNCNSAPKRLLGKYMFPGSSLPTNVDTLTIAVHFSKVLDTLTQSQLHQGVIPARAKYFKTFNRSDNLIDFEIDLRDATNREDIEYVTIMLLMESQILFEEEYSTAVIDDLSFE